MPPSCAIATSKDTRVLVDGSVNSSATVECSLSDRSDFSDDTRSAMEKIFLMSAFVMSLELMMFVGSPEY
jgi:hypothetical protein